jgi:hypothetical protein
MRLPGVIESNTMSLPMDPLDDDEAEAAPAILERTGRL